MREIVRKCKGYVIFRFKIYIANLKPMRVGCVLMHEVETAAAEWNRWRAPESKILSLLTGTVTAPITEYAARKS